MTGLKINNKQTARPTHDLRHQTAEIMTFIYVIRVMIIRFAMHHTPSVRHAMIASYKGAIDPDHCCIQAPCI